MVIEGWVVDDFIDLAVNYNLLTICQNAVQLLAVHSLSSAVSRLCTHAYSSK